MQTFPLPPALNGDVPSQQSSSIMDGSGREFRKAALTLWATEPTPAAAYFQTYCYVQRTPICLSHSKTVTCNPKHSHVIQRSSKMWTQMWTGFISVRSLGAQRAVYVECWAAANVQWVVSGWWERLGTASMGKPFMLGCEGKESS